MYGYITTYDMRIGKAMIDEKNAILKATKSPKSKVDSNEYEASDMEESNFIQKLKRGQGKYKCKFSFKGFNYG